MEEAQGIHGENKKNSVKSSVTSGNTVDTKNPA